MKLGSYDNGKKDGVLVLVTRDLKNMSFVPGEKISMQMAIDDWANMEGLLQKQSDAMNAGQWSDMFPFDAKKMLAPLPRSYQWLDGSAYVHHVELARKSRGAEMPKSFWEDPLMYQGASDYFYPGISDFPLRDEAFGLDFEAEIFVVTKDVLQGTPSRDSRQSVLFVGLLNDWSYRNLISSELSKGFGFVQSKPHCALAPLLVTLDELKGDWLDSRLQLPVRCVLNGMVVGEPNAGVDMVFGFDQLIAHAAYSRNLLAGTMIGAGTVSNKNPSVGSACLVEKRMLEKLQGDSIRTPFLKNGDQLSLEVMKDGVSVFGEIKNKVLVR